MFIYKVKQWWLSTVITIEVDHSQYAMANDNHILTEVKEKSSVDYILITLIPNI